MLVPRDKQDKQGKPNDTASSPGEEGITRQGIASSPYNPKVVLRKIPDKLT